MRGVDIKEHEFAPPPVSPNIGGAGGQEVYQLAADMGEMGFIGTLTIHHWLAIIPLRLRAG